MSSRDAATIRATLEPYLARSTVLALALFAATLAVYAAGVAGALFLGPLWARCGAAVLAGLATSSLFVIGHDAAHGAFTDSRRLNGLIGRIAFLPMLHNYRLWQVQHNRLHHRFTNLKGSNSWSPLSKAEYDRLPRWRRGVERLYRSPLGFAPYYLVERWWKDKFFPRGAAARRGAYWLDFALLIAALAGFLALLAAAGAGRPGGALAAMLLGFAVPFVVFAAMMGATTYLQHTHPLVPWFEDAVAWRALGGQEEVTVQLQVPRWYGFISHHIMDHPAHHLYPKIPLYRLAAAQRALNATLGERIVAQRFSPAYLLGAVARCKLYDYHERRWLDFAGRPTTAAARPPAARRTPLADRAAALA